MPTWFKKGAYNAICDICGRQYKSDELRKNWKGLYVCHKDFETRQPLDFIRARSEQQSVPWARTEPDDTVVNVCYVWGASGYAGLGVAGCMVAGQNTHNGTFLQQQRDADQVWLPPHLPTTPL